ncbi:hypothetical protein XENTR_v10012969 [Xenopus tropicalis]|nr:hypothetical protein XENTR_v10012969 [Xenopus tropicalis]
MSDTLAAGRDLGTDAQGWQNILLYKGKLTLGVLAADNGRGSGTSSRNSQKQKRANKAADLRTGFACLMRSSSED